MVFCNEDKEIKTYDLLKVTILILIDGFLQFNSVNTFNKILRFVTILILIDGFLQCNYINIVFSTVLCHNPYFNRWFSAIFEQSISKKEDKTSQSLF